MSMLNALYVWTNEYTLIAIRYIERVNDSCCLNGKKEENEK